MSPTTWGCGKQSPLSSPQTAQQQSASYAEGNQFWHVYFSPWKQRFMHIATLHKCSLATNFTQTLKCKMWFVVQYIFHKLFFHKIVVNHEYLQKHKYHDETRQLYTCFAPWCDICCHCIQRQSQTAWHHLPNMLEILTTCISTAPLSPIPRGIWHIMWKHDVHKTEVHNILHCRQRRTKPRPQLTYTENFVKSKQSFFKMHKNT